MLKIVSRNSGQVTLYIILTLYNAFGVKMGRSCLLYSFYTQYSAIFAKQMRMYGANKTL